MDFHQLDIFVKCAKLGSFSKASEMLYVSQPTISTHIKALESKLGVVLFERLGKEVKLTEQGKVLYKYAQDLISLKEEGLYKLNKKEDYFINKTIFINSSTVPGRYILPKLIYEFKQKYPFVKFYLNQKSSKEAIKGVADYDTPVAFVGMKPNNNKIEAKELIDDELVLITPNTEEYSKYDGSINIKDLLEFDFVIREEGSATRKIFENGLNQKKLKLNDLNISLVLDSTDAVKEAVKIGLGISILSKKAIQEELASGELLAFNIKDFNMYRKFYLIYNKSRIPSPSVKEFIDFTISYSKKRRG